MTSGFSEMTRDDSGFLRDGRYPGYQVMQLNFIIGIQGTIVEHRWRCNLTTLGIERRRQDKIIRRCMTAIIEGMQRVLSAAETGGEG